MPLHAALRRGRAGVAQLLLEHCVDVGVRAADCELAEIARKLIGRHADIMARDSHGWTPLHLSIDAHFERGAVITRTWCGRVRTG